MIRAAAKNHDGVAVVTDPVAVRGGAGGARGDGRRPRAGDARAAGRARRSAAPRSTTPRSPHYLRAGRRPGRRPPGRRRVPAAAATLAARAGAALRYGENPHQAAAFYRLAGAPAVGPRPAMKQLHGPELGYNNLLDFSAALGAAPRVRRAGGRGHQAHEPVRRRARRARVGDAMGKAKASDPVSIYGGIVGVNRMLDMAVVKALPGIFVEILFAPAFAPDALEELARGRRRSAACSRCRATARALPARLTEYPERAGRPARADGGPRRPRRGRAQASCRDARRPPTSWRALRFAWRVGKHAKSNAIVLATADQVIGVGAGQMNRVDSARLAVMRAPRARASRRAAPSAPPTRSSRSATASTSWPRRARRP